MLVLLVEAVGGKFSNTSRLGAKVCRAAIVTVTTASLMASKYETIEWVWISLARCQVSKFGT